MDNIQMFKEKKINDYLSNINLKEIDIKQIQTDLKPLLGEEPAIKLNYIKETSINEDDSTKKDVEILESFTVIFTIEKEIYPGYTIPSPIEKTFII